MTGALMRSRRFAPMFWCQFFAALGDNFLKTTLALLALAQLGPGRGGAVVTLSGAIFVLPFFVLSALGGELADRYDKARIARTIKLVEIAVALLAAAGMVLSSVAVLFAALILFGILAAVFGPVKYAILPDQLRKEELTGGNALIETATFAAILIGSIGGGIAAAHIVTPLAVPNLIVAGVMLVVSTSAWAASRAIRPTGEAAPMLEITRNPWSSTVALLTTLRSDARLSAGAMIVSWFWLVGAVALSLLPTLVRAAFNGSAYVITLCLAMFAIGIAAGSLTASSASRDRPNLTLIPIGAALMTVFCLDIAWIGANATLAPQELSLTAFLQAHDGWHMLAGLWGLAFAGGLFIVPAFAQVQLLSPPSMRARVVAAVNAISAGYMAGSGILVGVAQTFGATTTALFLALALGNAGATLLTLRRWDKTELHGPST